MELFELVGKITVKGADDAKKSVESTVDSVKSGAEKISDNLNEISGITDKLFNDKRTFKYGFEEIGSQNEFLDENAVKASLDKIGSMIINFSSENKKNILDNYTVLTEKLNSLKFPLNIENTHEIDNVIKKVSNIFSGSNNILKSFFDLQGGNMADEIAEMKNTVSEGMPQVLKIQMEGLEKVYSRSIEKWHKIGSSAAVGISDMAKNIRNGKSLIDSACLSVAESAFKNLMIDASPAGEYIMNTLDSGIYNSTGKIYATASGIANTISQTLSNFSVNVKSSVSTISKLPAHAKGGIVTREHIARVGEDGAEAIIPLEKNTEWIDRVASRLNGGSNSAVLEKLDELIDVMKRQKVYLDSGTLVGEIAPEMDKKLGSIARLKRRGAVL